MNILLFLVLVGILVLIHEYGHYLQARLHKVKVEEFSIGFGPRVFSFERKDTKFSIRLLPIGGFVNLAGLDVDKPVDEKDSFQSKSWFSKFIILASGVIMNFLLAIFILTILFNWGIPSKIVPTGISSIVPNSPAEVAGLKVGDKIIFIDQKPVTSTEEVINVIKGTDKPLVLKVDRNGKTLSFTVTPRYDPTQKRRIIGITMPSFLDERYPIFEAFMKALEEFWAVLIGTLTAIWGLITGRLGTSSLSGPVGLVKMTGAVSRMGFKAFLQFMALLSIQWGLFNILPIPALDGGRILFLILGLWKKIRLSQEKENIIHYIGFLFLMILMIIITIGDIKRF
ncbi:MAG: RIP metalloprotease RseP [bacterium]